MLEFFKYNFMAAFAICGLMYVIGEWVSTITKAWVPSVFVTACLMLLGYWHGVPHDLVTDSVLIPFGASTGIFLLLVHMGTIISFKQLMEQWKVVVWRWPVWLACALPVTSSARCSWIAASSSPACRL